MHSSGVKTPGQLGPIKMVLLPSSFAFTFSISSTGMPSVIQIINSNLASIASRIESAANGGGTITIDTVAPVFATASFTVLNTGTPKWVIPPLPGVTPATNLVPYSSICSQCCVP